MIRRRVAAVAFAVATTATVAILGRNCPPWAQLAALVAWFVGVAALAASFYYLLSPSVQKRLAANPRRRRNFTLAGSVLGGITIAAGRGSTSVFLIVTALIAGGATSLCVSLFSAERIKALGARMR